MQQRRALQLDRFQLVKRLQAAGHTAQAIMRETGFGRASVRKWVHLNDLPTRHRMAPRAGMPECYREYLWGRWTAGCQSGRLLMAEIQARGYVAVTRAWPSSWPHGGCRLPSEPTRPSTTRRSPARRRSRATT